MTNMHALLSHLSALTAAFSKTMMDCEKISTDSNYSRVHIFSVLLYKTHAVHIRFLPAGVGQTAQKNYTENADHSRL